MVPNGMENQWLILYLAHTPVGSRVPLRTGKHQSREQASIPWASNWADLMPASPSIQLCCPDILRA